ncbi:uncharacterized protein LACBIDRAFT_322430 [Laccaria bicolor S238N-H82]|uniref:Predicted protein n=1 Tax=Laccaria bicolor (strain S238N-H82 / ATCC MYA-4686) TaxID=486041 RepID=B0CW95_LACBS|nr:uncharacterized protein LACBIDRAFT_322430 [Laccaria bicolor S238N-H82]EDR13029.1 predicted protein [Laccaria bicolor S238N-H82]|eukprot:XP_001875527.1 predicted protein [Laccaria bicolor S238N-H82]
MPVTFSPTSLPAESFPLTVTSTPLSPSSLLASTCPQQSRLCASLLQSSLPAGSHNTIPKRNGLVHTIVEAYNRHRHLRLRPDDIWTAILIQFNFFVNGRSEQLRSQFVAHKGKKELVVHAQGNRYTVNFGAMAKDMTRELEKNILDPSLRAWILPKFSTTTTTDTIIASVIMMSSMKKYFDYRFCLDCGIPSVTLEGEQEDWEEILRRIEKLKEYGVEATGWCHLLRPIMAQFVAAFDNPASEENKEFWGKVCHREGGGSGPTYLGGWVTAFCAFDEDGKWLGHKFKDGVVEAESLQGPDPTALSASDFFATYTQDSKTWSQSEAFLILSGTRYHLVDTNDIPAGCTDVDVLVDDNGEEIPCMMTAGLFGTEISGDVEGKRDTVRPVSGWWMFEKAIEGEGKTD